TEEVERDHRAESNRARQKRVLNQVLTVFVDDEPIEQLFQHVSTATQALSKRRASGGFPPDAHRGRVTGSQPSRRPSWPGRCTSCPTGSRLPWRRLLPRR